MAVVSRLQLNHPALGSAGGVGLHASIEALYTKIGDNMNDRWFSITDFDQTETEDLLHNFETDISNIQYDLWNYTGSEWVHLTEDTTPKRSDFTVVEKTGAEDTTLQITNNTGGDNLTFAVSLTFGSVRLDQGDIQDVDVTSTPPEDGQALVYDVATGKFRPGASGDASFKIQSVSDPNATIKGGFIILDDGRELATYDGSGGASTDYGKDLTVSLDTILGTDPADATTYYLYIDLNSLSSEVTLSDNGRKVYGVVQSNFHLSTVAPELKNNARYVSLGFIRSATTGTVWSGTGAAYGTLATRRHTKFTGVSVRNYLQDWYTGKLGVSVTSGITATGNITPGGTWKASNTSLLTIANQATGGLREIQSLKLDHVAVGAAFVQTPEFTLDTIDLGKPVTVTFDHGAVTAADDYQVYMVRYDSSGVYQESIPIFGTASATSPFSARIPAGSVGTFQGFFISRSEATDLYALRYARNSASDTTDVLIDTLYVGPQNVVQGAAGTDWLNASGLISFTNRAGGALDFTRSAEKILYRQEGDSIFVAGEFVASSAGTGTLAGDIVAATFASGLAIDFSKMPSSAGNNLENACGYGLWSDAGVSKNIICCPDGNTNQIIFFLDGLTRSLREGDIASGDIVSFRAGPIPIVGWSSNVTMANRAVEEYYSNTGSTTTAGSNNSAATSFYGLAGVPFISIASTTTTASFTTFDITLPSPAQPTDRWKVEMRNPVNTIWIDAPRDSSANTARYGVFAEPTSSTNLRVYFGNAGASQRGATYGSAGQAWSDFAGYYWRVRKVSGGASVGFPVSARNVVGDVSGTAVPSGFIGEVISFTDRQIAAVTSGWTAHASALTTLTKGLWLIVPTVAPTGASSATNVEYLISSNSTNDNSGNLDPSGKTPAATTQGLTSGTWTFAGKPFALAIASDQAIYAKSISYGANRNCTIGGFAVRIG